MANRLPFLYIQQSEEKGRCIFTAQPISQGSSIESCPVIILTAADTQLIHQTRLHDYYFLWGNQGESAIALGFGSIYNHATSPNTNYEMDIVNRSIDFFATRDIKAGEEITVSYTEGGLQRTQLWFEVQ